MLELARVSLTLGDRDVLRDVTFTVGPGERIALIGPSGAGKSTLLAVLHGRVAATSGTMLRFGEDPMGLRGRRRRDAQRRVAMMFQDLLLVPNLRVVHNVTAGCLGSWSTRRALWSLVRPQPPRRALEALHELGLADRLHDRSANLSGGELQRVAVARLLAPDAELLLADEPTASLDPERSEQVTAMLASAASERATVIAALHSVELACRHFDRVIAMRDGRIVLDGDPQGFPEGWQQRLYTLDETV